MLFRKLLLVLFTTIVIVSCKKEDAVNNEVAAVNYSDVAYGSDPLQKMDVYLPAGRNTTSTKVMVLIHGGAWFSGDKLDFGSFIDSLKRRFPSYALFNINYRLSSFPNNLFPTQEMDTKTAVEFIYSKRNEYKISDNFTTAGFSAGAHLALLHAYKYATPVKIKVVVDFFGPADINDLYNNPGLITSGIIDTLIGGTPVTAPGLYFQSSPVNFVTGSAACPTIILQGSDDPLVNPARQSGALRDKLLTAGVPVQYVEYTGKGHGDDWDSPVFFDAFNKIQAFTALHNP